MILNTLLLRWPFLLGTETRTFNINKYLNNKLPIRRSPKILALHFSYGTIFSNFFYHPQSINAMTIKKILLLCGIGFLTYLLFKKPAVVKRKSAPIPAIKSGVEIAYSLKEFGTKVAKSITKKPGHVGDSIPEA